MIRVLHVLHQANRGGIETAIMELFRRIDRRRYQFDFLVRTTEPGHFDNEIGALGGRIFPCRNHRNPVGFARAFLAVLAQHGPYDVVHSHIEHFTGLILPLAAAWGIPVRIGHSHNDRSGEPARLARRAYRRLMSASVNGFATHGFAPSAAAARFLFGDHWRADPRWRVVPLGIDFAPYRQPVDRESLRASLGIPADAFVVGHIGRFHPQKNHAFMIRILSALFERRPDAWGVLIGDGELRAEITAQVAATGIAERIVFAGIRSDVPDLLRAVVDVFLFPSRYEGLGLVLVEAQAAGLPCVIADGIPAEADVLANLIQRLSLDAPVEAWVDAVAHATNPGRREEALDLIERSQYALATSLDVHTSIYDRANPAAAVAVSPRRVQPPDAAPAP